MKQWSPDVYTKNMLKQVLEQQMSLLPSQLHIDEFIPGCEVIDMGTPPVPNLITVALVGQEYVQVLYRGGLNLIVGDFCTVIHLIKGDRYEVLAPGGAGGTWGDIVLAENVEVAEIGAATYDDLQDWLNNTFSSMYVEGCEITENAALDGTIDIAAGHGYIKIADTDISGLVAFDIAADAAIAVAAGLNYIWIDYAAGAPVFDDGVAVPNHYTELVIGKVYKDSGNHVHILQGGQHFNNFPDRVLRMLSGVFGMQREYGLEASETAVMDRALYVTAGVTWQGINRFDQAVFDGDDFHVITGGGVGGTVSANNTIVFDSGEGDITAHFVHGTDIRLMDSSNGNDGPYTAQSVSWDGTNTTLVIEEVTLNVGADTGHVHDQTFTYWYYNGVGAVWVPVYGVVQIDNLNYDDVTLVGLDALTVNKYGVHWVFEEFDGHVHVLYGQGDYTLGQADAAVIPASIPDILSTMAVLIAKVIIQQNAANFTAILSAWETPFGTSSVPVHDDLAGLDVGDYHHLTAAEYAVYGTDADAIHDNVAGEIAAIANKAVPINADYLVIEDSADGDAKKHVLVGALPGGAGAPHNLLSATHLDTVINAALQGYLIRGDGTPDWERFSALAAGFLVQGDGADVISAAFDWDTMAAGAGADMVHDHSAAGEGDEIPLASLGGYTQGDLVYGGAADWEDLAVGNIGDVLTVNAGGTEPEWQAPGGGAAHALLSATHNDTDPQAVSEGSIIYGDATPDWTELVHPGAANRVLQSTAAQVGWSANAVTFPTAGAVPVGGGVNTQVAYWTAGNTLAGDAGMTYVAATDTLTIVGDLEVGGSIAGLDLDALGDMLFNTADGLLLLNSYGEISATEWWTQRLQMATLSGAFRQPAGRWAGTEALAVEPAGTNILTNPSLETNTTGWAWGVGADEAGYGRITTDGFKGTCSGKAVSDVDVGNRYVQAGPFTRGANDDVTWSVWVKSLTGISQINLAIFGADYGDNVASGAFDIGLTWTRISMTVLDAVMDAWSDPVDLRFFIANDADNGVAKTWLFDAAQVELTAWPTSYIDGDQGTGYAWTGADHASTSTRAVTEVNLDAYSGLVSDNNTMSFRTVVQMPYDHDATWPTTLNAIFACRGADNNNFFQLVYYTTGDVFMGYINGDWRLITGAQTFNAGDWMDLVVTYDFTADDYNLYINGVLAINDTTALTAPTAVVDWQLGAAYDGTAQSGFVFSEYAVFDRVLTADEIENLYAGQRPIVDAGSLEPPYYPGAGGAGGDSTYTDVYAGRPAASNDGDLFLPSDGFAIDRDTGAAWVPWGPIYPLVGIANAPTTWVNQNDSVLTTTGGAQNIYDPAQANTNANYSMLVKAAPATPYTITALFLFSPHRAWNYCTPLLFGWRDSGVGNLSMFRFFCIAPVFFTSVLKASSPTTDVADYFSNQVDMAHFVWARMADNNTNLSIYLSPDGQNWYLFHTIARTNYLANPDQVLWGLCSRGTGGPASTTLVSWKEA